MVNSPYLLISAIPDGETVGWGRGQALLNALVNADARLMPEKVGVTEPLRFQVSSINDCESFWAVAEDPASGGVEGNADSFMWKRTRAIKSSGLMIHKHRSKSGRTRPGRFIFRANFDKRCDWKSLFIEVCSILRPKYATLHYFGEFEQDTKNYRQVDLESYGYNDHVNGLPFVSLAKRGLANISWANYFGPDMVNVVPEEIVRSAGFPIRDLVDGKLVLVSEQIHDVVDRFPEFSRRRAELKGLFGIEMFRIASEPQVSLQE